MTWPIMVLGLYVLVFVLILVDVVLIKAMRKMEKEKGQDLQGSDGGPKYICRNCGGLFGVFPECGVCPWCNSGFVVMHPENKEFQKMLFNAWVRAKI